MKIHKFLLGLFLLMVQTKTFAITTAQFFIGNQQAMINIVSQSPGKAPDKDAQILFDGMNVPLQNSPTGPGKGLYSSDRNFNLACGFYNGNQHCTIVIRASADSSIDSRNKGVAYNVKGLIAAELNHLFFQNTKSGFEFVSTDRKLGFSSSPNEFSLIYSDGGF